MLVLLFLAVLFVAYANGANDNFKGVATLYGGGVAGYRTAITLATLATFAGSLASLVLAAALAKVFSGKGVVPDAVAAAPAFMLAVAFGAGLTVITATLTGLPVSTTHALTGGIVGAGAVFAGADLNLQKLGSSFLLPLLLGPLLSVALTAIAYGGLTRLRRALGVGKETCVCIGAGRFEPVAIGGGGALALAPPSVTVASATVCVEKYAGRMFGLPLQRVLDGAHAVSAATVSFARGLNDTPKIVGLLLVIEALDVRFGMLAVAAAMATGGLLNARKVAQTMSKRIAVMSDGQAFTANFVTGLLVIAASRFGLPVSTTHVSVGAISGVGLVNGTANARVLTGIVLSWVATLPMAAAFAAALALAAKAGG